MVLLGSWNPRGLERGTLEPDSPQGTLLSQMFPGYADVYFTGGKCEAYRGEVQVTDTVRSV